MFDFEDDNLAFHAEALDGLCRLLMKEFPSRDVQFLAMNGICYWNLHSDLLALMKAAGFPHLNLSLVTLDENVQREMSRPHDREKYLKVVNDAARLGFKVVSYQILGLPGEDLESMVRTLVFHARLPVLLGASPFYLTPGSPISRNFPTPSKSDFFKARLTALSANSDRFTREDIYTLFIATRIVNFLKSFSLEKNEASIREVLDLAQKKRGRAATGAEILKRLWEEKRLYAATPNGLLPLPRFQFPLFEKIWNELDYITTQEGKTILIG